MDERKTATPAPEKGEMSEDEAPGNEKPTKRRRTFAMIAIVTVMLIWGVSFIVMKGAVETVSPGLMIVIRASIAAAVLLPLGLRSAKAHSAKLWAFNIATGAVVAFAYITQTAGLQYTTPGKSGFYENVYCLLVPLLVWALTKKRPTARNFICMALSVGGAFLIGLEALQGEVDPLGDGLSIAAGLLFGVNIVLTGLYAKKSDAILYTGVQFATVALISGAYTLLFEKPALSGSTSEIFALLYLGLISTALSWLLRNIAQKTLSPSTVSVILPFSAVVSAVLSAILGMDVLTAPILIGGAMLLSASVLDGLPARRAQTKDK